MIASAINCSMETSPASHADSSRGETLASLSRRRTTSGVTPKSAAMSSMARPSAASAFQARSSSMAPIETRCTFSVRLTVRAEASGTSRQGTG